MAGAIPNCIESPATCRRCAYNLTGLTSHRCPECGTRFDSATPPPFCLRLEHVLFAINVFAFFIVVLLVCTSSASNKPGTDLDAVLVWAMLLPLQSVIALAGAITGMHLLHTSGRTWMAAGGIIFPLLSVMISLLLNL